MTKNPNGNGPLSLRAIVGSYAVALAWDVATAKWSTFTKDLLGFAIERAEFDTKGKVVERYWLRGMKRFESRDRDAPVGMQFPLSEAPIQSFQWGDYSVKPGTSYEYRLVPVRGTPKKLDLMDDEAVTIHIAAQAEDDGAHGVWFNRGVAASQAYARKFPSKDPPDQTKPDSEQMRWLSRGLYEALCNFVGRAKKGWSLRGALYEFHYDPFLAHVKEAVNRGADVKILYDEPTYGAENKKAITKAGLTKNCKPRAGSTADKHNKFFVLLKGDKPQAVWTGSTNISAGGIFGHSNVGHLVSDADVAQQYLDYWETLWNDPNAKAATLKKANGEATPTPDGDPDDGITTLFSPRDGATLDWYAERAGGADRLVCFTVAFTVADVFAQTFSRESKVLRYLLKDKSSDGDVDIMRDKDVLIAVGSKLEKGELAGFLGEKLTGFNKNLWIHDKFMLVDPLGADPLVVSGSANFSKSSQVSNDENMLVIRGNVRVAQIYFTEFMRVFDHLYSRWMIKRATLAKEEVEKNFLTDDSSWTKRHEGTTSPRAKRRRYFAGTI